MGLLGSRWKAEWEGHEIEVHRNEVTKGFKLICDGEVLSNKSMSLVGVGKLEGVFTHEGEEHTIKVALEADCEVAVDGNRIAVRSLK